MLRESAKPTAIPINGYSQLYAAGPEEERAHRQSYQRQIGNILYAMINTRPDTAFAIGKLSQYMSEPAKHHEHAVRHL